MATQFASPTGFAEAQSDSRASLLDKIVERQADVASRYQPVMDIEESIKRYEMLRKYIEKVLVEGVDYGKVPGVDKPFLFKPGAQKLCMLFGYVPHYESRVQIEDWGGDKFGEPLFYYQYSCMLSKDGKPVGEGIGSANSWESKYRYRWVSEDEARRVKGWESMPKRAGAIQEFTFAVDKAETSGAYGKPAEYWQRFHRAIESGEARKVKKKMRNGESRDAWEIGGSMVRAPNDQFPDVINTCQKQGEKRAYVEATLSATGASQFFTQDEEGFMDTTGIDTGGHSVGTQAAADHVANQKIADMKQNDRREKWQGQWAFLRKCEDIKAKIGTEAYYRIIGNAGYEHANEVPTREKAKAIYQEFEACLKAKQENAAAREAEAASKGQQEPQPAATMADLPDEMWADGRE